MRRHLNTLYLVSQGAYVAKEGANLVVRLDAAEIGRVPIHQLGAVVAFGQISLSPFALGFCAEQGVSVAWFTETGRFLARMEGPVSGNVLLRRDQHRRAEDAAASAQLVASLVAGKVLAQRHVLRRALRDHGDGMQETARAALEAAQARLTDIARRTRKPRPDAGAVDALRGMEGEAAQLYFGCFGSLIRSPHPDFAFTTRSRRPPLDAVNALLSFCYALLTQDCRSALEAVGLDPAAGYLHALRPGRPSLALDLMEEFRPAFADRLALSLINRGQVTPTGFERAPNGAVSMTEQTRKTVLTAWQTRKRDEVMHPFLQEKTALGLAPHLQARLLARAIRGELDAYPPFLWR